MNLPPRPSWLPKDKALTEAEAEELAKLIDQRLSWGKAFWKPAHDRMDFWMNMYLLLDLVQQAKPHGYRRYISNDPQTAIDAAVSISTRNDSYWQIDTPTGAPKEVRQRIGRIEQALAGLVDDMDELFILRGEMRLWTQVAYMALLRGWVVGKFHVTEFAREAGRPTPLMAEMWDFRFCYPNFDGIGLGYILVEKHTTFSELRNQYPEAVEDLADTTDPNADCIKVEYWSNTRGERAGVTGVMARIGPGTRCTAGSAGVSLAFSRSQQPGAAADRWLIPPYRHGYTPEELPVVCIPVNGIPLKVKPHPGSVIGERMAQRADRLSLQAPSWHSPAGWVAEMGRSILAHVEEQVPQYNELIATIFQHFSMGTYPTWAIKTQTGNAPNWEPGLNKVIPLRLEEDVQRFDPAPVSPDAYRLLDILQEEKQKGILSNILQAVVPFQGTGILFQQIANAALNALQPFTQGMRDFGTQMSSHILAQMRVADVKEMELFGRSTRSYFHLTFDPKEELDRKYKPVPVFKPALPDDYNIRAQTARILLDPRRPVMSLFTVLENVLQVEDPEGEIDRIFEDIAQMDPVIVLERIADTLERFGETELAERIREQQFRAKFVEDLKMRQLQAASGGEAVIPGQGPETGVPSATGAITGRPGQGQAAEGGPFPAGAGGERRMP